jgi:hypothetical protein
VIRAAAFALTALAAVFLLQEPPGAPEWLLARDDAELRAALERLRPGVTLLIAPGAYSGRHDLARLSGTDAAPIVICGDPADPPVFTGGGSEAWHLSACSHLTLRDLVVRGFPGNGINVDDAGERAAPARGIRIERVTIEDTGPSGNHDALKMSGVDGFLVKDCSFRGWGGSAVDLVGCHDGEIEGCTFEGRDGFDQQSGVQIKGGSARVAVRDSRFLRAGARGVNAGGHTGRDWFRPPDAGAEARDVVVEGCAFSGGEAPIAAVGVAGLQVRGNLILRPEKWVLRVLLEHPDPRLAPCSGIVFADNSVAFDGRLRSFVNAGVGVSPDAYSLRGNRWIEFGEDGAPVAAARRPDGD